jgi:hypothetical protein
MGARVFRVQFNVLDIAPIDNVQADCVLPQKMLLVFFTRAPPIALVILFALYRFAVPARAAQTIKAAHANGPTARREHTIHVHN